MRSENIIVMGLCTIIFVLLALSLLMGFKLQSMGRDLYNAKYDAKACMILLENGYTSTEM